MQMSHPEDLTLEERQQVALSILPTFMRDIEASRAETARWKARHKSLISSTMLVIGALLLIITGLAITVLNLLAGGCQ